MTATTSSYFAFTMVSAESLALFTRPRAQGRSDSVADGAGGRRRSIVASSALESVSESSPALHLGELNPKKQQSLQRFSRLATTKEKQMLIFA